MASYKVIRWPGHPRAMSQGRVLEHVAVLWEKLDAADAPCHWCGELVQWGSTLKADHVDGNTRNNAPENLVPACNGCNITRGKSGVLGKVRTCVICGCLYRKNQHPRKQTCGSKVCAARLGRQRMRERAQAGGSL